MKNQSTLPAILCKIACLFLLLTVSGRSADGEGCGHWESQTVVTGTYWGDLGTGSWTDVYIQGWIYEESFYFDTAGLPYSEWGWVWGMTGETEKIWIEDYGWIETTEVRDVWVADPEPCN